MVTHNYINLHFRTKYHIEQYTIDIRYIQNSKEIVTH